MVRRPTTSIPAKLFQLVLRRIAAGSMRTFAESVAIRGFGALLGFAYNIALSRMLGPSGIGVVSFYLSIGTYVGLIATSGMDTVGLREIARHSGKPDTVATIFNAVVSNAMLSILVYMVGLVVVLFFLGPEFPAGIDYAVYAMTAAVLLLVAVQKIASDWLIALRQFVSSQLVLYFMNRALTLVAVGAAILWLHASILGWEHAFLFAYVVGLVVAVGYGAVSLFMHFPTPVFRWRFVPSLKLLREGMSCSMQIVAINVLGLSPFALLGWLSTKNELGLFSAAQRLAALLVLVLSTSSQIAMHDLAQSHRREDSVALARALTSSLRLTFVVAVILTVPLFVFAPFLVLIFGKDFHAAAPALMVFSVAIFILCNGTPFQSALLATNNERYARNATFVAMVVGVGLNAILIPRFGAIGAAAGTGLGFMLQTLGHARYVFRVLPLKQDFAALGVVAKPATGAQ